VSVLIDTARQTADGLAGEGMHVIPDLLRRLADALQTQGIELENRTKCHQEALGVLREAQAALVDARGILESIRRLPEPEGFVFRSVIRALREWQTACGPAPFFLASGDINALELHGESLMKSHHDTRQALSRPRQGV
jgi:hypothetical protein